MGILEPLYLLVHLILLVGNCDAFLQSAPKSDGLTKLNASSGLSFDGSIEVSRTYQENESSTDFTTTKHEIKYHIHNRMNMSSMQKAPILVLHGGPGVPSDYLHPLTDVIPYRSIVFYDQLGCGRSPGPECKDAYSLKDSVDDLELLIKKCGLRRFHLYGQSFGAILAFEYLKRLAEKSDESRNESECLSVILSSGPSDVDQVEGVAGDLISKLMEEDSDESTIMERFRKRHQCQTENKPQPLIDAYDHAGKPGIWRGTDSIKGWKAEKPSDSASRMPSALVMRGENDFVSDVCIQGWKQAFNHKFVRIKVLEGCSHHGLLEQPTVYGEIVDSFFSEYD